MFSPQDWALAILIWHAEHGRELAHQRLAPDALERYLSHVDRLEALEVNRESMRTIAQTQIEFLRWSSFEHFSNELQREHGLPLETLGEVAQAILEARDDAFIRDNDLSPLRAEERRTVRYHSQEDLLHFARAIYPQFAGDETNRRVGAVELLVSFALERQERDGQVVFLPAEAYGFKEVAPHTREHDLLDLVREGVVTIDVLGDTGPEEEEEHHAIPHSDERQ
jgi:hypothetical protein